MRKKYLSYPAQEKYGLCVSVVISSTEFRCHVPEASAYDYYVSTFFRASGSLHCRSAPL